MSYSRLRSLRRINLFEALFERFQLSTIWTHLAFNRLDIYPLDLVNSSEIMIKPIPAHLHPFILLG